jgi:hypothetical protein
MNSLREEVRSSVLELQLDHIKESPTGGGSELSVVSMPLSEHGDEYYYVDGLPWILYRLRRGYSNFDFAFFSSQSRVLRPQNEIISWSEAVDFSVEKELLSRRYNQRYNVEGELSDFLSNLERESRLNWQEHALGLGLIATPFISKQARETLGKGGAIAGGFLGLLNGLQPSTILTTLVGAAGGYVLGAMSPAIAGALYLWYKSDQRKDRTRDPLREGKQLIEDLENTANLSRKVLEYPSSNIKMERCFDRGFPMDVAQWMQPSSTPTYNPGLMERALFDVLTSDVDGFIELSDRAKAYYWKVLETIDSLFFEYDYRDLFERVKKHKPIETIELRPVRTGSLLTPISTVIEEDAESNDWTMPQGNPQRTNTSNLRGVSSGLEGLVLTLNHQYSYRETVSGDEYDCSVTCSAYDYNAHQVWERTISLGKDIDCFHGFKLLIHNNNVLIIDKEGYGGNEFELDLLTGEKVRTFELRPSYVYDGKAIYGGGGIRSYPSDETNHDGFKLPEEDYYSERAEVLGIVGGKVVYDYDDYLVIMPLDNPEDVNIIRKRISSKEKLIFSNMDEDGIVGVHHSEDAIRSIGKEGKEGEFSKLVYIGFDGDVRLEHEFGLHVYPDDIRLLDGSAYLEVGRSSSHPSGSHERNIVCFDLGEERDVWIRKSGLDIVPTPELVYLSRGEEALDHMGGDVWKLEDLDEDFFGLQSGVSAYTPFSSITANYIVQLININRGAYQDSYFLRVNNRLTGRELDKRRLHESEDDGSSFTLQDMVCVDFN